MTQLRHGNKATKTYKTRDINRCFCFKVYAVLHKNVTVARS